MEEQGYRRIARLVRQNQELQDRIRQLAGENDRLERQVDNYERRLSRIEGGKSGIAETDEPGKFLKFKTGTVLFADVQGFSKLTEQMDVHILMDELDSLFLSTNTSCKS
jgi:class 3 adenylate cyclase